MRMSSSSGPAITIEQLTKSFGAKRAVDGVSFEVPRGSVYGLIGPNGAGKTTTFSIIAGFLRPSSGHARVLGVDPWNAPALRGRLGVLPQDAVLPPLDRVGAFLVHLAQLGGFTKEDAVDRARVVLAEVGGADWWTLRCNTLSHGMAKRVSLAQALLGDPEVVLLDEPTAGLDPKVAHEVRRVLHGRRGRTTLVISSHNLQELEEICDDAAVLDRGKLVTHGSIAQLTSSGQEVHVGIDLPPGQGPGGLLDAVRALPVARRADWDEGRREVVVFFEPTREVDAEAVIAAVLPVLLAGGARIGRVVKGRSLEQRVIDVTR